MDTLYVKSRIFPLFIFLLGLSVWMTLITLNNINDSGTNTLFIKQMLNMSLFDKESGIGTNLLWRSMNTYWLPSAMLWAVVAYETVIDIAMWRAVVKCLRHLLKNEEINEKTRASINIALTIFMGLFLMFICGGMWFGYWMHQGPFQMVHVMGIILSMLGLISNK